MAEERKEYAAVVEVNNVITEESGIVRGIPYNDLIPGVDSSGDALLDSYITSWGEESKPPETGSSGILTQTAVLLDGFAEQKFRRIRWFNGQDWSAFYPWERTDDDTHLEQTENFNHTLELDDVDGTISLRNSGIITIPTNAHENIPVGAQIDLFRRSTGSMTVVAEAGVSLLSPFLVPTLRAKYSRATLHKMGTNEWAISGDIG